MKGRVNIRPMVLDDIEQVVEIEKLCFAIPWTFHAFNQELRENKLAIYFVAEQDNKILGYGGAWQVLDEFHITNIAVHPNFRGLSIGREIVERIIKVAYEKQIKNITLEVRKSNRVAQNLYKDLGFKLGGIRKEYYDDNREDAFIMWKEL